MSDIQLAPAQCLAEQTPEEWEAVLRGWGEPRYRALQIFRWIHQRGILSPAEMTDVPKRLRDRLEQGGLAPLAAPVETQSSQDGTKKLLVELGDGRRVETVLIPRTAVAADDIYAADDDEPGAPPPAPDEVTQCVSLQVGCAMGCAFCASGIAGLKRQMTAGEIVAQVSLGRAALEGASHLAGLVFMGMGEPLHNYDAVCRALVLLSHPEGLGMSL